MLAVEKAVQKVIDEANAKRSTDPRPAVVPATDSFARPASTDPLVVAMGKAVQKVIDEANAKRLADPRPVVPATDSFATPRRGASPTEVALTKVVRRLSQDIETLEAQNTTKLAEVDGLVKAIAEREAELETEYQRQRRVGMLGAVMGMPAVVGLSLVELKRTDRRLEQLRSTLASARADQQRLHQRMDAYLGVRASVVQSIERLRASTAPSQTPIPRGTPPKVRKALAQAEATRVQTKALQALRQERQLLTELREDAQALGTDLSQVLTRLDADLSAATRAVTESQAGTRALLESLLSDDPDATALKKLQGQARKVVQKRLEPVVARLLAQAPASVRPELSKRLLSVLTDGLFS